MGNWRNIERNLQVPEYAKRVCDEIHWPRAGNLTLMCECISSFGLGGWGGFIRLMEAVELAREQGIRVDRWFFQDGKYNGLLPAPELDVIQALEVAEETSPAEVRKLN